MEYKKFFSLAESKGISNIQITEETEFANEIIVLNNTLEDYSTINKTIYTVKAEYNGKTEKTTTDYLDESIIDLLLEKINNTDSIYQDNYLSKSENNIIERKINVTVNEEIELLKKLNELKNKFTCITNLENYFIESYTKTRIINNNGVDIATDSHTYKYIVEATAEKDGEITNYSKSVLTTNKAEINFQNIATMVMTRADQMLDKQPIKTNKYNVLLDTSVASSIIGHIAEMLSSENIRQKTSCLTNSLNNQMFSHKLTILENSREKSFPGFTIFDKEGTKTANKVLIENGVIKTYLYNNKEANLENTISTGNAYGGIGTRNMFITPTDKSLEDTISQIEDGLYITDYMGASSTSINCSTGNISIQIFGFIIKDGKLTSSFKPCIMTTTIFELLTNIEEICSDLTFEKKSVGSPSIFISNISVAGE